MFASTIEFVSILILLYDENTLPLITATDETYKTRFSFCTYQKKAKVLLYLKMYDQDKKKFAKLSY